MGGKSKKGFIKENSSQSSQNTEDEINETNQDYEESTSSIPKVSTVQNNNTSNTVIIDMTKKSVFNYTNFGLTTENFPRWFKALKRHLTALKLIQYINVKIDPNNMEEIQNEEDNATQSIIENSLDDPTSKFIIDCQTAYEMIEELKSRFDQSGPSKLYKIEYKIKTLKIENNDYKLYLNNLNTLFESHKREANKLGKSTLDEETKILFAADELVKIGIHPINLIQFKTFSDLKNSIITMEVFIKKCKEIKRIEENPNLKNQVNAVSKTNINKPNNKNYEIKNKENYCYICQKDGHTTDTCFFNVKRKNKNRNNPRKNDIRKQKGRKNTKFHSNNIKNESDSTDNEDSEEENINIGFSGNITVNNITQSTKENDKTEWIIDSGCPINLTNEIRKLKNTKNIKK